MKILIFIYCSRKGVKMRRIAFIAAGCFLGAFSSVSVADESGEGKRKKHTVSLGYVYTDVSGGVKSKYDSVNTGAASRILDAFNWQDGGNLKYRYEHTASWGGMVSLTNSARKVSEKKARKELTYSSLMFGPTYRFNDYLSTYALAGVSKGKYRVNNNVNSKEDSARGLSSGIGIQVNPVSALSLEVGYEFSHVNYGSSLTGNYNSWIVSAGYRF